MTQDEDAAFETVMEAVGNDGYFQKRFNFWFNFILVFVASMPYLNILLILSVPDHWCKVPGRENTNYSINDWKILHIPKENNTMGKHGFSKCNMYDKNGSEVYCKYGWEFDTTWYKETAPSQAEWVCDKALHVTNALLVARIGEGLGTLIFGQMADAYGRKPVFFVTLVVIVLGRVMSVFTSQWIALFFLSCFIGNLPSITVFLGPLIIGMEVSKSDDRAKIAMMQCIAWTVAFCMLPFVMWLTGNWMSFLLITTLPLTIYIFSQRYIIESPRWLASKGKIKLCLEELEKIAKVNNTKVPPDAEALLEKCAEYARNNKSYGVISLFSSWRLAKNTIILIIAWSVLLLVYYFLTLNINNLGGNPFLNFFWQGLAELPAYVIGKYASNKFGRRWTNVLSFVVTSIGCIPLLFLVQDAKYEVEVAVISVFLKFSISFAFYVVNLQSLETYPTCVRQSGISLGGIIGNFVGMIGPYMVYVGTNINATYPYILNIVLCALAGLLGVFLPETLNKKLPETLEEAAVFGADQDLWGTAKRKLEKDIEVLKPLKDIEVIKPLKDID